MHAERGVPAPDGEAPAYREAGQRPVEQQVGAALEAQVLKVDSRRR